jgi:hypothetical protein
MDDAALLAALVELAAEHELPVRRLPADSPFEGLVPAQSGVCLLRGRRIVLLCASDPLERQKEVLAQALRAHAGPALERRFLPPALRACLEGVCSGGA